MKKKVDQDQQSKRRSASALRRFKPTAHLPTNATLQRLSEEDRELLDALLETEQECVYHPSFRRRTPPGEGVDLTPSRKAPNKVESGSDHPELSIAVVEPTELLSAEQERVLFLRFNYYRHRVIRILRNYRGKRLTAQATRDLLHWHKLALDARTDVVRANTSLVLAMARRSRAGGVEISELVSEGNLALIRCVDKFDASRGFKFSTYACRAILAAFSRAGAKAARQRAVFPTPYDPSMERSDFLDRKRETIEHECIDELKRILFENSAELSSVERRVLDARFHLDQAEGMQIPTRKTTLDQVGAMLGVSKERVRQIQNQAMDKLRNLLEERMLAAS